MEQFSDTVLHVFLWDQSNAFIVAVFQNLGFWHIDILKKLITTAWGASGAGVTCSITGTAGAFSPCTHGARNCVGVGLVCVGSQTHRRARVRRPSCRPQGKRQRTRHSATLDPKHLFSGLRSFLCSSFFNPSRPSSCCSLFDASKR